MKLSQNQTREYAELEKTGSSEDVRTLSQELKRYGRFLTDSPGDKKKFESITLAFVNNNSDFEVRFPSPCPTNTDQNKVHSEWHYIYDWTFRPPLEERGNSVFLFYSVCISVRG